MERTTEKKTKYHEYAKNYIASYSQKIDCADLAIAALVEFSKKESLPIRFKYYDKTWKWVSYAPTSDDAKDFKKKAMLEYFSNLQSVHGQQPGKWKFEQFEP